MKWKTKPSDATVSGGDGVQWKRIDLQLFILFAWMFDCLSQVLSQTQLIGFPVVPKLHPLVQGGVSGWGKDSYSRAKQGETLVTDWQRGWKHYSGNNITLSSLLVVILHSVYSLFSPFIPNTVYMYCKFSHGVQN